ncbi:MAG TPA: hypothetical protein VIY27_01215 [Myxococcota bacterium]
MSVDPRGRISRRDFLRGALRERNGAARDPRAGRPAHGLDRDFDRYPLGHNEEPGPRGSLAAPEHTTEIPERESALARVIEQLNDLTGIEEP